MNLLIKKLFADAKIPQYAHPDDAGMDFFAQEDVIFKAGERKAIGTGVALKIPQGYVGLFWDKSSRALTNGLKTMAGVIDAGYRGEIKVVLLNSSPKRVMIKKGEKIAQILIQPVVHPSLREVAEFTDKTSRGTNGFGSTGI
ncbi:MAG: hypothetical protein A2233_02935 [Candidatus Kerfeldbacteria bacterium RIFOXYA2_FULL_38_24]|uniref:dUTP diphosphatase n=1 Tax=Candidatus Kerfeldbacteria bacterium RIFOXYB2_FULL_38_14 TaxID=1798547 RepID=A0A1G2BB94_9BACT|nr:MAG: hypothetical protein A2319_05610 [Candidatus Kerfeldbacteria bacterium RIFOXYB2_FULL_38_14]OGY86490.1 MAG: hypothetical protein A2233_02935 [Candidatus Kerfeldbacteria bacterium RIFOXYA2_FULL_38_24]